MLKIQSFKLIFVLVSSISLQLKYKILNKTRLQVALAIKFVL